MVQPSADTDMGQPSDDTDVSQHTDIGQSGADTYKSAATDARA